MGLLDLLIAALILACIVSVEAIRGERDLELSFQPRLVVALWFVGGLRLLSRRDWALLHWIRSRIPLPALIAVALLALGILGSWGMNGSFHRFLFEVFSQFRAIRAPARWVVIAHAGIGILAALGVSVLGSRLPSARHLLPAAAIVLLLIELYPGPITWYLEPPADDRLTAWLASVPVEGPLLYLPVSDTEAETRRMLHSTGHRRPMVNGFSGHEPEVHRTIRELSQAAEIDGRLMGAVETIGVSLVVVEADLLHEAPALRAWLRDEIRSGRLSFLKKFDGGGAGNWVFGVTRNAPLAGWVRDRTTGSDELRALLAGDATPSKQTVGAVQHSLNESRLTVSGWAGSFDGVEAVTLLFANERIAFEAFLDRDADPNECCPWYSSGQFVRFHRTFGPWPAGVPAHTTMKAIITDGRGNVHQLKPIWLDRSAP